MSEIDDALRTGRLAPSRASKLAGKLSWGGSAVFGRGCRCYLAPLYRHAHQKGWRLDARTKAALQWWARFLPCAPRKVIPLGPAAPRPRVILYSDATGRGRRARARASTGRANERAPQAGLGGRRAGWALLCGGGGCEGPAPLGEAQAHAGVAFDARAWKRPRGEQRRAQVAAWELVAAVCTLRYAFRQWPGAELLFFVDSKARQSIYASTRVRPLPSATQAALGVLRKGCSRQEDYNALVTEIWLMAAQEACLLTFWWALSAQNIADAPTRPAQKAAQLAAMREAGFCEVPWAWPGDTPWSCPV